MGQGLPGWPILPETTCMTRKTLTLILFATFAGAAAAQDSVDINGDGVLTLFEIQAVWPEVSTDGFMFLDRDGDGLLGPEEFEAARQGGHLAAAN
ncbi:EF hand [Salipiger thiooxidans]|uniref:EF hand n=2 Tax=Salipiger thiooxidans TaxID=282683 RepID=A0A1G7HBJ4_9RHOB|nr:EF hand [Salipiger thiooxidans]